MTKQIKGYWQNLINHVFTTALGIGFIAFALFLLYENRKALDLTIIGISSAIVLVGLVLMGAKDRINIFKKNIK